MKINFLGDIMLGERFEKFKRGVKSQIENNKIDPFEYCKKDFQSSDLNVGNLECVVSTSSKKNYPFSEFMKISEDKLEFLINNNIKVVNIANNHIFDHGIDAFEEMKEILKRNNIKYFGFGDKTSLQKKPLLVNIKNKTVGFLGYDLSNTSEQKFNEKVNFILKVLSPLNKNEIDILILSLHWGYEYTDIPTSFMIQAAKQFIDKGADIIYGHHPHILQGITKIDGSIFAPSLGNFIFDDEREKNRYTGILKVNIDPNNNVKYSFEPYYINEYFQPVPTQENNSYFEELNKKLIAQINLPEIKRKETDKKIIATSKFGHSSNKKRVRKEILSNFQNYIPFVFPIIKDKIIDKRLKKVFMNTKVS